MLYVRGTIAGYLTDLQLIYLNYTGVITVGQAEGAVLTGTAPEGATPWGNSCKFSILME